MARLSICGHGRPAAGQRVGGLIVRSVSGWAHVAVFNCGVVWLVECVELEKGEIVECEYEQFPTVEYAKWKDWNWSELPRRPWWVIGKGWWPGLNHRRPAV
jgi:starvation-inducible outer membrane lipoprotein